MMHMSKGAEGRATLHAKMSKTRLDAKTRRGVSRVVA